MNWTAIGAIGEVLSAGAVVLTLVLLLVQLKRLSQQLKVQNLRGQAAETVESAKLLTDDKVLDVLEKVYLRNETDLSFKEIILMEAYLGASLPSIVADYELFKLRVIDEAAWKPRLVLLASILAPDFSYEWFKRSSMAYPDLARLLEDARSAPEVAEYYESINSRVVGDGV